MTRVTIADAPAFLSLADKAMWVLGWNDCVDKNELGDAAKAAVTDIVRDVVARVGK